MTAPEGQNDAADPASSTRRIIKRYSNRKLYDTRNSSYVTLLNIAEMVRAGEDVQIIDNATKEDKTDVTLALIISEELKAKPRAIPLATLKALIRHRGGKLISQLREGPIGKLMPKEGDDDEEAGMADLKDSGPKGLRATLEQWQIAIDDRIRTVLPDFKAFRELQQEVGSRPVTTASVNWSPSAWSTVGQKHQTPNLAPVIQQVIDRSGWASGNAMVVIVTGTGERTAEAYEGSASQAALLHIEYDTGTGPSCGDGSCNGTESCSSCAQDCGPCGGEGVPTEQNLLVAFIGDQGNNGNSTAVLQLIATEGAHAVVHNGDFDYADNPTAWDNRVTNTLGSAYPYFAVVGNHDAAAWGGSNGYAAKIAARHARNSEMVCSGELGVKASCNFRGLHLIQSCVGTSELRSSCGANSVDQVNFIGDTLASSNAIFKVCSWHKNQNQMQVGTKGNEVGWVPYQTCMEAGAIISTGHEHSYSRTKTLTDLGNSGNAHGAIGAFDSVNLGSGKSFVFVSGLAGVGMRAFSSSHASESWWASYYTSDRWYKNGVNMSGTGNYGALFIRFYVDGDPKKARAYFKDVSGRLVDEFTIYAQ